MKFWKVSACVAFVALTTGLLACTKSVDGNNCLSYAYAPILSVNIPDTANINTDVPFGMSFNLVSNCGHYRTTDQGAVGDTLTVAVIAEYSGCSCDQLNRVVDTTIPFRSSVAKKYYLKFFRENGVFIRDSIVFK